MTRISICAAAALLATAVIGAAAQGPADIALPADPSTVVVSLDSHDYWGDLSRTNQNPLMTIRADGTLTIQSAGAGGVQPRLSKPELQALLRFLIQDQDFFSLNAAQIERTIHSVESKIGTSVSISDAAERTIRVRIADKEHEVRFYAAGFFARRYPPDLYPELKSLGQLREVETKLLQIMETQKAGGEKVVLDALAEGNTYLKREYPQVAPFTVSEFQRSSSVGQYPTLTFSRTVASGEFATLAVTYRPAAQTYVQFSEEKLPAEFLRIFGPVLPPK